MYIIEDGKAYQIKGEVAYQVKFDSDGKMTVEKEKEIDAKDKQKYSYDEMYRKLNIKYAIEMAKLKKKENEEIQTLKQKVETLEEEKKENKDVHQEKKGKTSKK